MIDVARRLRRAILLNDLLLVKRIVRNNPDSLRNPDFEDKSNTSLHLASKEGFVEIAEYLIDAGHEDEEISRNTDWETPLMLACQTGKVEVGKLLIRRFPRCVPWTNKAGMDALMLCCRHGTLALLPLLLNNPEHPASVAARDCDGNTALHHASAAGELKAVRLLLQYGASPVAQNAYSWTPIAYSATKAAELYFSQLVQDLEKRKAESSRERLQQQQQQQKPRGIGGVRLVTTEDVLKAPPARDDEMAGVGGGRRAGDWSPVEMRRAMTPTSGRSEGRPDGWFTADGRVRANSGH